MLFALLFYIDNPTYKRVSKTFWLVDSLVCSADPNISIVTHGRAPGPFLCCIFGDGSDGSQTRTEPDIFQPNTSQVTEQCSGGSASPANAHVRQDNEWLCLRNLPARSRLSVLVAGGTCGLLGQSQHRTTSQQSWHRLRSHSGNGGTGSTQRGFDPPEPLLRKLEKVQLAEGEQRGSRKAALIATAPQSVLRSTTSNGRAQTQGWRVSDWAWGQIAPACCCSEVPDTRAPRAKCCKAKTKPSPWLQLTALGHAIIHSDEALCQELLLYKTIGYCCRWLPQQGHLGNFSKSPCECCHRIQSTAASSLCSRLSCRRIAK